MTAVLHIRQQIRDRVVDLLMRQTNAGPRVFGGRPDLASDEIPGLVVLTPAENSEIDNMGGALSRTLQVVVVGIAQGIDVVDQLDALCLQVETVLGADRTLGGLAYECSLTNTAVTVDEGSPRIGNFRLTFSVWTRTAMSAPGAFL